MTEDRVPPSNAEAAGSRRGPHVRDRRKIRIDDAKESSEARVSEDEAVATEEQALEAARSEAAAHLEDLQRLKAEFENYRKRIVKEQTEFVERASASLIIRMLAVLDNFELAVAAAESTRDFERMLKGVELVFGELKEVLAAEGLRPIEAVGKRFDPNLHEAAVEIAGEFDGDLFVADVLRAGYTLKGRVLRPAMVKVVRRQGAIDRTPHDDGG